MSEIAVVTGGGSGVGRAVAHQLAAIGWRVAVVGRTEASLEETIRTSARPEQFLACPCDVSIADEVAAMADRVRSNLGDPTALVNCAGTNIVDRQLEVLSPADWQQLIDTNLTGTFLCVHAFLPAMRRMGRGTIVNVISDAGLRANATAGAAYVASKFGMAGLTQSINAEHRAHGVRACGVFPGEINTPLLDKRPSPPPQEKRMQMLQADDVAACVLLAITLPPRAVVEQLLVMPR
ncbi:MAG: SDR family NAD(P)-dependent oxidoreductase [Burkholderiales bacterium]|nr:SDR family NAD(P)-dependent oxidoreductase [Phycisphaerae bacterium]